MRCSRPSPCCAIVKSPLVNLSTGTQPAYRYATAYRQSAQRTACARIRPRSQGGAARSGRPLRELRLCCQQFERREALFELRVRSSVLEPAGKAAGGDAQKLQTFTVELVYRGHEQ